MNFDHETTRLDFVKHRKKYFIGSSFIIGLGMIALLILGLNLAVDFESGTSVEIMIDHQEFTTDEVVAVFESIGMTPDDIRLLGNNNEIAEVLFIGTLSQTQMAEVENTFIAHFGEEVDISEATISPEVARELARQAIYAIVFASLAVIIYVTIRFEYRFAGSAIVALFHDALFVVAVFSILRMQVDLTFIAAVLTIVGYSINDTIVIFDRIRENLKLSKVKTVEDLEKLVNKSIIENLARSINTSLTVVFVAACLFLFGGEGIRNFAFALMIGLLAGAYSSIFIAAQVWLQWKKREILKKMFNPQADS